MDSPELTYLKRMNERDSKMWALTVSEFADTKTLLNVLLALTKFQLQQSGVSGLEIDQQIQKLTDQYRADAQEYAKKLLELTAIPPVV